MRKSTRAVVQAPASAVVGMMNSSGVSVVMVGTRYSSFTLSRPEDESIGIITNHNYTPNLKANMWCVWSTTSLYY